MQYPFFSYNAYDLLPQEVPSDGLSASSLAVRWRERKKGDATGAREQGDGTISPQRRIARRWAVHPEKTTGKKEKKRPSARYCTAGTGKDCPLSFL